MIGKPKFEKNNSISDVRILLQTKSNLVDQSGQKLKRRDGDFCLQNGSHKRQKTGCGLKETKETWSLNVTLSPGMGPVLEGERGY